MSLMYYLASMACLLSAPVAFTWASDCGTWSTPAVLGIGLGLAGIGFFVKCLNCQ